MVRDYDESVVPAVYNLREIEPFRQRRGFTQVVFRGLDHMIGFTQTTPEKEDAAPHTHPYEQTNMLLEGRIDFLVDGERVELHPYDTLSIPPGVPHTSRTVAGESATFLAFWPLREDFIEGTAYQREFPSR